MLLLLLLLFLFCKLWKIKEACASWLELTWTRRIDYDAVMGEQEPQQHGELLLWLLSENHSGWFLWKKIPGGLKSKQSWKGMKEKKKTWGEKILYELEGFIMALIISDKSLFQASLSFPFGRDDTCHPVCKFLNWIFSLDSLLLSSCPILFCRMTAWQADRQHGTPFPHSFSHHT